MFIPIAAVTAQTLFQLPPVYGGYCGIIVLPAFEQQHHQPSEVAADHHTDWSVDNC